MNWYKENFELRIIDNSGSIISQQTITRNSVAETNNIPVNLEKLSSGVYYIQLQQKGKRWWQKIILQ
ncbi:T9SS type A sorting domain-containing protein [Lacibacter sediminis]|uniref:T9SS type A sorting domain-containing protein n=1 Tax=Lacibacter sediminis TaxID=2760713 RepID=A0A7G5XCP7_9BACT|nr:T9SS type A sorting domain-containing protein [Lacibacter sediminis]